MCWREMRWRKTSQRSTSSQFRLIRVSKRHSEIWQSWKLKIRSLCNSFVCYGFRVLTLVWELSRMVSVSMMLLSSQESVKMNLRKTERRLGSLIRRRKSSR